eukprot:GDKI01011314.1.p2 GENE.GDKI01011314.1~~GDKI01011314.1.p2  ORF type:complete len:263 (-),score=127.22 GDKI01011314.1:214-1002(-)
MSKRTADEMSNLSATVDGLMQKGAASLSDCYGDEKKQFALQSFLLQAAAASGNKLDEKLRASIVTELQKLDLALGQLNEETEETTTKPVTKETLEKIVKNICIVGMEEGKLKDVDGKENTVITVLYKICGYYHQLRAEYEDDITKGSVEVLPFGRVGNTMSLEDEEETPRDADFDERPTMHSMDWVSNLHLDEEIDAFDMFKCCGIAVATMAMHHVPQLAKEGVLPLFIEKLKTHEPEETELEIESDEEGEVIEEGSDEDDE